MIFSGWLTFNIRRVISGKYSRLEIVSVNAHLHKLHPSISITASFLRLPKSGRLRKSLKSSLNLHNRELVFAAWLKRLQQEVAKLLGDLIYITHFNRAFAGLEIAQGNFAHPDVV